MNFSRLFRLAAMLLVPALLSNSVAFAAKKPADPAVMKAKIQARGVGQGVRVTLADQTEAKGLIVAIGDQTFTLKPKKSREARQIEFAQITGVHNDHLTRGQKVGITVGVTATAIAIFAIVLVVKFDNSFKNLAVFPAQH
jgi:hypothetical protein